jgi:hypothetical protein
MTAHAPTRHGQNKMKLKGKMKDRIRKTLRRWWKNRTNKTIKLAAVAATIAAIATTATAREAREPRESFDNQNTGGYYYNGYREWSVWSSIINALKSPYVWMAGLGGLSHSFDASPDPGQTYWSGGTTPVDTGTVKRRVQP